MVANKAGDLADAANTVPARRATPAAAVRRPRRDICSPKGR